MINKKKKKNRKKILIVDFIKLIHNKFDGAVPAEVIRNVFSLMIIFITNKLLNNSMVYINNFGTFAFLFSKKGKRGPNTKFEDNVKKVKFYPHNNLLELLKTRIDSISESVSKKRSKESSEQ